MSKDAQGPSIRRVSTGQAQGGLSVIASDEQIAPIETPLMPGAKFYSVWGADSMPALPNDGAEPAFRTWFPPDGGYRFEFIVLPPNGASPPPEIDRAAALAETEKKLPGLLATMDQKHPGMHQTDTIDLIYVTEGACVLVLDGGGETALSAGDTVVLNGPRHAWRNSHDEPCGLLTVSIGVRREG